MKGLIFIPDINGFTAFVKSIPSELGAQIIQDLLSTMISCKPLNMEVSEIEGDAILFYKIGPPIPVAELVNCFMEMQQAFKNKYQEYKIKYNLENDLSLKLIVHYGDIIVYNIHGFKKLYGEAIIEAHRLLKNGNAANDYVLVTEDYMQALNVKISDMLVHHFISPSSLMINAVKHVAYHLFPNAKRHLVLQT